MEQLPGRVRLVDTEISWRLVPEADGAITAINEAHVDPGSGIPGWLVNMMLIDRPFRTMQGLRREVNRPQYADAEMESIREPHDE